MTPRSRRRRAFTLMELMVAFAVLSLVTVLIYQLMIRGATGAISGVWRTQTTRQLQNASERIRKVMEGSSYPSVLTPEYNILDKAESHYVVVGAGQAGLPLDLDVTTEQSEANDTGATYTAIGPGRADGSDGTDGEEFFLFAASNCSPARSRIAGLADKEGIAKHYYFWLTNRRPVLRGDRFTAVMDLMYAEVESAPFGSGLAPGSDTPVAVDGHPLSGDSLSGGTLLVGSVNSVRIRVLDKDNEEVTANITEEDRPTLEIGIRCVEADSGKAVLGKLITVQPNTGIRFE